MSNIEKILKEMEPKIKLCIKKYSRNIDNVYSYEDLLQEGYITVIKALKKWDGINKRSTLSSYIWMALEWKFRELSEKKFVYQDNEKLLEKIESKPKSFDGFLNYYFGESDTPETILLEKLTVSSEDANLNVLNIIFEILPKRLQKYVKVLNKNIFDPEQIALELNCSVQNIVNLKKDLTKFIEDFEFEN